MVLVRAVPWILFRETTKIRTLISNLRYLMLPGTVLPEIGIVLRDQRLMCTMPSTGNAWRLIKSATRPKNLLLLEPKWTL